MTNANSTRQNPSRRSVLKTAALGSVAAVAAPYVRTAYAAGTLSLGVWDHWVPGANKTLTALCEEWGAKNSVEVKIDYITSQGEKDKLTAAAEAQAGTGHDIMSHRDWNIRIHAENSIRSTMSSTRSSNNMARSARCPNILPRSKARGVACRPRWEAK